MTKLGLVSTFGFLFGSVSVMLACLAFSGCPPTPPVPPGPSPAADAAPAPQTACQAACANLADLGCPEGKDQDCAATCQHAQDARLTDLKPEKLAAAKSIGEVMAVGTVACDASPGKARHASCADACGALSRFGCPEASGCLNACQKAKAARLTNLELDCLAGARTKAALRACGSVACR